MRLPRFPSFLSEKVSDNVHLEVDHATHNKIVSFIWNIADDVLRDIFVRSKYRDVILPMCVLRRLDAVLEPTKKAVLETKATLETAGITEQRAALNQVTGQAFYNTSPFTLRDLKSRASQQQLELDFNTYLNGFSPNVQDILLNFEFHNIHSLAVRSYEERIPISCVGELTREGTSWILRNPREVRLLADNGESGT